MSRRPTRREPGLPAAAALAGGITSAHRSLLCETCGAELAHRASDGSQRCEGHLAERVYDHPQLQTEREASLERERLELEEWTALREVRLRAEILLATSADSPLLRDHRDELRAALERAEVESDRITSHLRRPTVEGVAGPCPHPGAGGPCLARLADGRCVWCERALAART